MSKFKNIFIYICVFSLIFTIGCSAPKDVAFYPNDHELAVSDSTPSSDELSDDSNEQHSNYICEYNPTKLSLAVSEQINEELQEIAVQILSSVHSCQSEIVVSEDVTDDKFKLAYELALYSNPLVYKAYVIPEEVGKYSITYISVTDKTPEEETQAFTDAITQIMEDVYDENASKEDIAKNLYDYILTNYEYDYEKDIELLKPENNVYGSDTSEIESSAMQMVLTGKGTYDDFLELYMFVLNQLDIKNIIVGTGGVLGLNETEAASYVEMNKNRIYWDVVMTPDNSYHCVMIFDLLEARLYREEGNIDNFKSKYFGMSDDSVKKIWTPYYAFALGELIPGHEVEVPPCEEDYK